MTMMMLMMVMIYEDNDEYDDDDDDDDADDECLNWLSSFKTNQGWRVPRTTLKYTI